MSISFAAFLLWCGAIAVSRAIGVRAIKLLNQSQKLKLLRSFGIFAVLGLLPLPLITAFFWYLLTRQKTETLLIYAYFGTLLLYFLVFGTFILHRLRKLSLPAAYVQQATAGITVQYLGFGILFSGILLDLLEHNI
jgi:hypothetical protein